MPKAFIIVGHSNWGKSRTLRQLTDSPRRARIEINGISIFVKRMSNDDIPQSLINFLKKVDPNAKGIIIIALCPNFDDPSRKTEQILKLLKNKYTPYFFVLKKRYLHDEEVTHAEIQALRSFGTVWVLEQRAEDSARANAFRTFIESHL